MLAQLPKPTKAEPGDAEPNFDEKTIEDGEFVTVGRTANGVQANLWKLALESDGIPSQLFNARTSGIYGGAVLGIDIRVVVPISYKERAIEIVSHNTMGKSGDREQDSGYQE